MPRYFLILILSLPLFLFAASTILAKEPDEKQADKPDEHAWRQLFDGKTLKGWTVPQFGGDGEVKVEKGCLVIGQGAMMTGVKYTNVFPQLDYEIRFEAKRTVGGDFFRNPDDDAARSGRRHGRPELH